MVRRLVIRVYGIFLNEKEEVLLSDEIISGFKTTKFPGGGLELGEGITQCLLREIKEECNIELTGKEHFFTDDDFVLSRFNNEIQVVCVYYMCFSTQLASIKVSNKKFDFTGNLNVDQQSMRWVNIYDLFKEEDINLESDKKVVGLLKEKYPKVGFKFPAAEGQ